MVHQIFSHYTPSIPQELMDLLEDQELAKLVKERENEEEVEVKLSDL